MAITKPTVQDCPACDGTGQTTVAVVAGRGQRRRKVADQEATCLDCLGTGSVPELLDQSMGS
ncbi:hypothetical protein AB0K51_15055 [Kitasatospora sp. NPDC049285]|uniref:hypothetical protein n=1 Tax=Kitasatospora sp. NPDC049285 TaxID=3157096 RepID=UPI0034239EB4